MYFELPICIAIMNTGNKPNKQRFIWYKDYTRDFCGMNSKAQACHAKVTSWCRGRTAIFDCDTPLRSFHCYEVLSLVLLLLW